MNEDAENGTTTRIQYAVLYEYRKPPKGERPADQIAVMSQEKAEQLIEYFASPRRDASSVLRVTLLTRTVVTTRSDWEKGRSETPKTFRQMH